MTPATDDVAESRTFVHHPSPPATASPALLPVHSGITNPDGPPNREKGGHTVFMPDRLVVAMQHEEHLREAHQRRLVASARSDRRSEPRINRIPRSFGLRIAMAR
jgi:hypothetical protein